MDSDLLAWIGAFRPRGVPSDVWDGELGDFVRRCMIDLDAGDAATKRYMRVLANFCAWCQSEYLPLDRETILDPGVVDSYASRVLRLQPSGATYRSDLRRVCPKLTRKAPWRPAPTTLAHRSVATPYTESEIMALSRVVDQQSTGQLRRAGQAIFLLGLSAGLDGRWIGQIRATDVRQVDGHLVVDVPAPAPRTVPVVRVLAERVQRLVDADPEGTLIGYEGKGKNALSRVVARLDIPSSFPPLSPSRLRSTWLQHHVAIGTRLPELVQAAGVRGVTVMSDLLPTITTLPFTKYCEELEGEQWTLTL